MYGFVRLVMAGHDDRVKARTREPPMPPTIGNGKICYLEIPASDIQRSAEFYRAVFGWKIRKRG